MATGRVAAGAMESGGAGDELRGLYAWLDTVPLSRPRKNLARDFSDGVLVAELVKFYFPDMVQLHSYVPANSTPQKLANWGHLNRKVLSRLGCCLRDEGIQRVVQSRPGAAEQVLLLLHQRIQERLVQNKEVPSPGQGPGSRAPLEEVNYMETVCLKMKSGTTGSCAQEVARAVGVKRSHHPGCDQPPSGDTDLQLADPEQALLMAHKTIQILQLKVGRLEQLLQLKNVRIDDLSRQLQQCQQR